jgi:hypothetical protein
VGSTPFCVTVSVCPPTIAVPVRDVVPGFVPTLTVIVASPVPFEDDDSTIHDALLHARQVQFVVKVTEDVAPVAATVSVGWLNERVHGFGVTNFLRITPKSPTAQTVLPPTATSSRLVVVPLVSLCHVAPS